MIWRLGVCKVSSSGVLGSKGVGMGCFECQDSEDIEDMFAMEMSIPLRGRPDYWTIA